MPQQQLLLPFASLEFPGRGLVTIPEISEKLGCTVQHIINLVEDGTLVSCDLARHVGSRRMIRVPVEEYRSLLLNRLSGTRRKEHLTELPEEAAREIFTYLKKRFAA